MPKMTRNQPKRQRNTKQARPEQAGSEHARPKHAQPAAADYDTLLLLERLESLLEEMEELGVSTRQEIEARITALHEKLDAEED